MKRLAAESGEKLKELRAILMRISSLRNGKGGDVFFKSLANIFIAQPVMPSPVYPLSKEETDAANAKELEPSPHLLTPSS